MVHSHHLCTAQKIAGERLLLASPEARDAALRSLNWIDQLGSSVMISPRFKPIRGHAMAAKEAARCGAVSGAQ